MTKYSKETIVALHDACELMIEGKHRGRYGICNSLFGLQELASTAINLFEALCKQWTYY